MMRRAGASEGAVRRAYLCRLFDRQDDALDASGDREASLDFLDAVRWEEEITCPTCSSTDVYVLPGSRYEARRIRRCRDCQAQFSTTSGTPLANVRFAPEILVLAVAATGHMPSLELGKKVSALSDAGVAAGLRLAARLRDLRDEVVPRPGSQRGHSRVAAAAVAAMVFALAFAAAIAHSLSVEPLRTTWYEGGERVVFETEREVGESRSQWVARHNADVEAIRTLYEQGR